MLVDSYKQILRRTNLLALIILITVGVGLQSLVSLRSISPGDLADIAILLVSVLMAIGLFTLRSKQTVPASWFKILLIVGLLLRLMVLWHDIYDRPTPESDYAKYEKLGERLAFEHRYYDRATATGVELKAYRPPGLPFMMVPAYLLIGKDKAPLIVMTVLSFGVLVTAYFLLKAHNTVLALIMFTYVAISPNLLMMASLSNSQLPFLLIFLLLFFALQRYQGKWSQCALIGLLLAAGALTRVNMFLVLPGIIFFLWEGHRGFKAATTARVALVLLTMGLVLAPWAYRNYKQVGGLVLVSTSSGSSMFTANVVSDPRRGGGYSGIREEFYEKNSNLTETELDKALKREAILYIVQHPAIYLKSIPFRISRYMTLQEWTINYFFNKAKNKFSYGLQFLTLKFERLLVLVVLLLALGSLWQMKKINALSGFILFSYISYTVIDLALFECGDRYHFPYIMFPLLGMSLNGLVQGADYHLDQHS